MKKYHVFAMPTHEDFVANGTDLGFAGSIDEAVILCATHGHTVIRENEGGLFELYDLEDGPNIYGYEADGFGAIGITVQPE